ncbi:MAG: hypothetical protein A3K19_08845 [Lentisphaerae bacterium RIFOXYB12_FULL_65_16]|nr:MAG: hypothetical protein A3K18_16430 [Lentisphaerae bacterium RIFOXYA12_64_32]OGV92025.1 MAG: hypothetical protein A3K19_08845 [Lentisphaerae bacterium RIFOXYB12_FULL_65_16]
MSPKRKMNTVLAMLVLGGTAIGIATWGQAQDSGNEATRTLSINLLPDPGAVKGATRWQLKGFASSYSTEAKGDLCSTVSHSGKPTLHVGGGGPTWNAYWSAGGIPVEEGKRYVLSATVRRHGILLRPRGPDTGQGPAATTFGIHLGFSDAKGEIIQDKDHPFYNGWAWLFFDGHRDAWTPVGVAAVAPSGAVRASVTLRKIGTGEVWYDDVVLVQSDTTPPPQLPPDLGSDAAFEAPLMVGGDTEFTLRLKNRHLAPVKGLSIVVADSPDVTGEGKLDEPIASDAELAVPVRLHFPAGMMKRGVRVTLVGKYETDGAPCESRWVVTLDVMPDALMKAIATQAWGVTDCPVTSGSNPVEIVGVELTRDSGPVFSPAWAPLPLQAGENSASVILSLSGKGTLTGKATVQWECLDFFFRPATGSLDVEVPEGKRYLAKIALSETQVRRIVRSAQDGLGSRFKMMVKVQKDNQDIAGADSDLALASIPLPKVELPPLAPRVDTLPVYGALRLVDEVLCGDPSDQHPMRQGGKSLAAKYTSEPLGYYGSSTRLNFDWGTTYRDNREEFTRIETILGKPCRTADNWGWFAYQMGRGALTPNKYYVLEVEYPQDVSRNFLLWCESASGGAIGFHTGSSLGDPHTRQRLMQRVDLPLSQRYEKQHTLFLTTSGSNRWIAVHSMGAKADPFGAGVAVHALRLYEVGECDAALEALVPKATEPEGLPHRLYGFFGEDLGPSVPMMQRCAFVGMNFYAPITLSYCGGTYETNSGYVDWPSHLFGPDGVRNPHALKKPPYYIASSGKTDGVLAAADRTGMTVFPTLEYGGTGQLPPEALAVWPDGSPHDYHWGTTQGKDGRRTLRLLPDGTCIDMAHPAVGEDLAKLVTEVATCYAKHPSFGGIKLAQRFQAWQMSYSDFEVRRFATDRGLAAPEKDLGQWVASNHEAAFRQWYYERKRENLLRARDALQLVNPSLKLLILNYNGGDDNLHFGTPLYWWDKEKGDEFLVPGSVSLPDFSKLDLSKLIEDYTRPDVAILSVGMNPPLYRNDKGIWNLAIAHYPFTCGNTSYLDFFRTGEGSAVCLWWIYNEDANRNHNIGWNCPGLDGNEPAGRYCMLDEVLAMAASDPFIMGPRIGTFNRGFPEYAREFAAAFRALPAVPSRIVKACEAPGVVVRRYDTDKGIYLAVINTGQGLEPVRVELATDVLGGTALRDLVTGGSLSGADGRLVLTLAPVSLTAFAVPRTQNP